MKKILFSFFALVAISALGQNSWQNLSSPLGTGTFSNSIEGYNKNAVIKHGIYDVPVIMYIDNSNKINVKVFTNGVGWQSIGNSTNITASNVSNIDMEINPTTKEVYIVYSDAGSTPVNRPIVKKYNGDNTWSTIGGNYISASTSIINDINFDKNSEVCVAYIANPGSLNLKRYSSSSWNSIGISNIGTTNSVSSRNLDLEFSDSNIPYIVYWDSVGIASSPGYYLTRFYNGNWEYVNNSRIFNGDANYPRLVMHGEGIWIAYYSGISAILGYYNNGWQNISPSCAVFPDSVGLIEVEKSGDYLYVGYRGIFNPVSNVSYQIRKFNLTSLNWDSGAIGESNSLIYNNPTSNRISNIAPSFSVSSSGLPIVGYNSNTNTAMSYYYGPLNSLTLKDFNKSSLSMYPNPVLDHVFIANDDNVQINTYEVVDLNGRSLISKRYNASNNLIDLSVLTKGIYFINLNTEKGILSKKIIKE